MVAVNILLLAGGGAIASAAITDISHSSYKLDDIAQEKSVSMLLASASTFTHNHQIEMINPQKTSDTLSFISPLSELGEVLPVEKMILGSVVSEENLSEIDLKMNSSVSDFSIEALVVTPESSSYQVEELIANERELLAMGSENSVKNEAVEQENFSQSLVAKNFSLPKTKKQLANLGVQSKVRSKRRAISIATSEGRSSKDTYQIKKQNSKIVLEQNYDPGITTLSLQFVDDRSNLENGDVYPATNLNSEVIGSELLLRSDSMGYVHIGELPTESDLLVKTGDENGLFVKMLHQVRTSEKIDSGVTRLKVVRGGLHLICGLKWLVS